MAGADILFFILAAVILVAAMGVVVSRNPVYSALSLVLTLFCVAGLFLLLHAEFMAVIQVLTYAGAILVLFVFIIMLLNLSHDELFEKGLSNFGRILLAGVSVITFVTIAFIVNLPLLAIRALPDSFGSIRSLGKEIFSHYIIPFEVAGILLTVALIGAVLLAKKHLTLGGESKEQGN